MEKKTNDEFLMSPTVDFCFKELLAHAEIRKGFVAALLNMKPEEIQETVLLPTILSKETAEGKYGILDVRIGLRDGTQIDVEMQVVTFEFWEKRVIFYLGKMYTEQLKSGDSYNKLTRCIHVSILNFIHFQDNTCFREIALCDLSTKQKYTDLLEIYMLELQKLPPETADEPAILRWMRFLSGTKKEDFEKMAEKDTYINEAYEVLKKLSADDQKRLEYEARQKAIRDYNSQMESSFEKGFHAGENRLNKLYEKLLQANRVQDISKAISDEQYLQSLFQEFHL